MIIYNIQQNGTTVEMEIWVDPNNNGNWVKANDFVDSGGWETWRRMRRCTRSDNKLGRSNCHIQMGQFAGRRYQGF